MVKNITFSLLTLIAFNSYCAQRAIGQEQAHNNQDREAWKEALTQSNAKAFGIWKEQHKELFRGKKTDLEIVDTYIGSSYFLSRDSRYSQTNIELALKFAKHVYPEYKWWDDYINLYPKIERGKIYSKIEQVQLVLEPIVKSINATKQSISILKGEEYNPDIVIDWQKEADFVQSHMTQQDNWSMLSIMERAMPLKRAESLKLSKKYSECLVDRCVIPVITKKNKELAELRQQIELNNSELSIAQHHADEQAILFNNQIQNLADRLNESERTAQVKNARIASFTENLKQTLKDWEALSGLEDTIAKRDELFMRLTNLLE